MIKSLNINYDSFGEFAVVDHVPHGQVYDWPYGRHVSDLVMRVPLGSDCAIFEYTVKNVPLNEMVGILEIYREEESSGFILGEDGHYFLKEDLSNPESEFFDGEEG